MKDTILKFVFTWKIVELFWRTGYVSVGTVASHGSALTQVNEMSSGGNHRGMAMNVFEKNNLSGVPSVF